MQLGFNPAPASQMHLDINSCFATIEQQANPLLRNRPIGVVSYTTDSGVILAASIEAKKLGLKTAMRVSEARAMCPQLVIIQADPDKYRHVHQGIKRILYRYTDQVVARSIDEFTINFTDATAFKKGGALLAQEIKSRIRSEVGEWISVSIGLAPNRFLAKTASDLFKPDGLAEITKANALEVYKTLSLTDLNGVNIRNEIRLRKAGIHTVPDMYHSSVSELNKAFQSILSYYWYMRLRGWPIDQEETKRRSFGNQYSIPKPVTTNEEVLPVLMKLIQKTSGRLRKHGYHAQGVTLYLSYKDNTSWHQSMKTPGLLFNTMDIYAAIRQLFDRCPFRKPLRLASITVFNLSQSNMVQLDLFGQVNKRMALTRAMDAVNERFGQYRLVSARMTETDAYVPDHIGFGNVKELPSIQEMLSV